MPDSANALIEHAPPCICHVRGYACMHAHGAAYVYISSFLRWGSFLVNLVWYDEAEFCPYFFGNSMYNDHNLFKIN